MQEAIAHAARLLEAQGLAYGMRDARRLMTAALGVKSDRLTLHLRDTLSPEVAEVFWRFCERRAAREPVSRILEGRLFYGRWFKIGPEVLDPRPETEILVEQALKATFQNVLDIGTGSGCIVITLLAERPDATGLATDVSEGALRIASENAVALSVGDRLQLTVSDWFKDVDGRFDLIVSNPPYIRSSEMEDLEPEVLNGDPHIALTDFADGLTGYRELAAKAQAHLNSGGRILVEIGPTQADDVVRLFLQAGFKTCSVHKDFDGRDRVVEAFAAIL
ncbi:MAG: peptide chain release factor N(5)-glutamine methyltransferase [Boseongicola sp.]|nr:peptide chain release factor N(5)-glutamine methyltransferase [Boseongicola sp.]